MPTTLVLSMFALAALAAIFALAGGIRMRRGAWDFSSSFVFVAGCLLNAATIAGVFTGGLQVTVDVFYQRATVISGWLTGLQEVCTIALVVLGLVTIASGVLRKNPINGPAVGIAFLVFLSALATAEGGSVTGAFSPRTLALFVLVVACGFLRPGPGALLGAASFGVAIAVASALAAIVSPAGLSSCADKCGAFGFVLDGALGNGNGTGLLLAMALPAVFFSFEGHRRWLLIGFVTVIIASTGSRTALNATLVVLAIFLLTRPYDAASIGSHAGRRRILLASVSILAIVGVILPLVTSDPTAFTGRGYLWKTAMSAGADNSLMGSGTQSWQALYGIGQIAQNATYSVHNQYLDVWFISGYVGLLVFSASVVIMFVRAGANAYLVAAVALPASVIAITERPWSTGTIDWLTWSLLLFLLITPANRASSGSPSPMRMQEGALPRG